MPTLHEQIDGLKKLVEAKPHGPPRDRAVQALDDLGDEIEKLASDVEDEPYTFDHGDVADAADRALELLDQTDRFEDAFAAVKHLKGELLAALAEADKLQNKLKQAASDVADALRQIANEFPSD
jgi:uncharacterized protein YukE